MSDFNTERLEGMVLEQRDAKWFHVLVTEIEELLNCDYTCAVLLYDRLKVIRRAIAGMVRPEG